MGRGEIIFRDENGVYSCGKEKRTDGYIAIYYIEGGGFLFVFWDKYRSQVW